MALTISVSKKILLISKKKTKMVMMERRKETVFINALTDSAKRSCFLETTNDFATSPRSTGIFIRLLSFSKYLRF
jgi:hypothetical protein